MLFSRLLVAAACTITMVGYACAQKVMLQGVAGQKAILVIDGAAPKLLAAGESHRGVKVLSVDSAAARATVSVGGKSSTIRMGESPGSIGGAPLSGGGGVITIPVASGGHFMTSGSINGRSVRFLVDTGATTIAMGVAEAERIGLNYKNGTPVRMGTANGTTVGYAITLDSVRIGDVQVHGVQAVVGPNMPFVLLGNSFLSRFKMTKQADIMRLERSY